ncbi:MAG: 30S ribosomal protein S4 [Kiritimatiellia bacterium]
MGRYTGPRCRQCRAEGMKLFLKGARCVTAKCPVETGRPPPGMHGRRRSRKPSNYGIQLREKQRLRRQYGLQENQFKLTFKKAERLPGVTGEVLLQLLESRLDNVVYTLGFAPSRQAARQVVRHGHILLDGRQANIPSIRVAPGSVVKVKEREKSREIVKRNMEVTKTRDVPQWLTLDMESLTAEVTRKPTREEIAPVVNERLIVELYSK